MKNIILSGIITTKATVSVSPPDSGTDGNNNSYAARLPIYVGGEKQTTGYIPAATFRGTLRRNAFYNDTNGEKPLKQIYEEVLGQDAESEQKKGDTGIDLQALKEERESKPIIDLFGAGMKFKGKLQMSHAIPETPVDNVKVTGVRKDLDEDPNVISKLSDKDLIAWQERNSANHHKTIYQAQLDALEKKKKKDDSIKSAELKEINKQIKTLEKAIETENSKMLGMKNSTLQPTAYYALPTGVELNQSIRIMNANDSNIKMLFDALDTFSLYPVLGAHVARGSGEVSANYTVKLIEDDEVKQLGSIKLGGFDHAVLSDELKTYLNAIA